MVGVDCRYDSRWGMWKLAMVREVPQRRSSPLHFHIEPIEYEEATNAIRQPGVTVDFGSDPRRFFLLRRKKLWVRNIGCYRISTTEADMSRSSQHQQRRRSSEWPEIEKTPFWAVVPRSLGPGRSTHPMCLEHQESLNTDHRGSYGSPHQCLLDPDRQCGFSSMRPGGVERFGRMLHLRSTASRMRGNCVERFQKTCQSLSVGRQWTAALTVR
ncbi:hypothetical protein QBC47DRAFT_393857 [Echria macrotheca]|uniref:Uncharacterized protein n=1 Tax=Echria macrotheca TaxID=438768 RepID=A0AAJ0B571_9PEZI|nr:hypothetical protein QBC47DRAFT_393857 [Echria macrotheca]